MHRSLRQDDAWSVPFNVAMGQQDNLLAAQRLLGEGAFPLLSNDRTPGSEAHDMPIG